MIFSLTSMANSFLGNKIDPNFIVEKLSAKDAYFEESNDENSSFSFFISNSRFFSNSSIEILSNILIKSSILFSNIISKLVINFEEISEALHTAKTNGCKDILLFHCISSYPTPTHEANIKSIEFLRNEFEVEVGLSDHTLDNTATLAAISLGAVAIEKHFILSKKQKTPDSEFSIEPKQLSELIKVSKDEVIFRNEEKLYNNKKIMAGKSPKSLERFVADKIASLTDRNALEMHKKYFKSNYIL